MSTREKVIQLLKNYRSYQYAVSNGIAPYVEDDPVDVRLLVQFGPRTPKLYRGSWKPSIDDYKRYSRAVELIRGAVEDVLSDEEQKVIRLKYLERNTLRISEIADELQMSERRVIYLHAKALDRLAKALVFVEPPAIINLDKVLA